MEITRRQEKEHKDNLLSAPDAVQSGVRSLPCEGVGVKIFGMSQGALKGTNLRGQTEPKRRFSLIFADFCRFSPFPRKQSIWETQIFAENR